MPVTPISPSEVKVEKTKTLPDLVIKTWNNMITKHYSHGVAQFDQEEIVNALVKELVVDRSDVFKNRWLDIEDLYKSNGWSVYYDRPGYNEFYSAYYRFTAKSRG